MHRFKNAGGEDGGEEEETNTTTTNTKNDTTNTNNAAPGKVNVSSSPSEKIINYAYRHGMSGKELKKRAKELKKRQMLERETKRLERRERRNSATTTSQVEEEEAFFNSATIPIPMMSEYAFSPSSASTVPASVSARGTDAASSAVCWSRGRRSALLLLRRRR